MFSEGDLVLIIDEKGRKYIFRIKKGGKFSSHLGTIEHNDLIGKEEGSMAKSQLGSEFLIFKPLYKDYIVKMPRGAQVIYPKDVASILLWADIFPGARVVEAGTGSGALTIALLRAIGTSGMLFSYEIREDFYKKAMKNIEEFMSLPNNLILKNKDIYEGIDEDNVDRVVLDLPEPWHVIPLLENSLKNGGIFLALLPTIIQAMNLIDSLEASRRFYPIEVFETMLRYWNVRGQSVRPEHFMVGHTAFIVIARKVAGNPSLFPRSMEHWKIGF